MNIVQPTFGAEVSFIFPTTVPGSLSVAALTGTTIYKQTLVGSYKLNLNVLHFSTLAVLDFKSFFVTIEDCANVWKPAVNLTTVDYKLDA